MLPGELRCLWNEQVPPAVKCKVMREHSIVDQDRKTCILTFNFYLKSDLSTPIQPTDVISRMHPDMSIFPQLSYFQSYPPVKYFARIS